MSFMNWIIQRLGELSSFFYELYLECYYAGWPLDILDSWFYAISRYFADLSWDFYDFSQWVDDVQAKVVNLLSWSTIWSYILSYIPNLEAIRDWFYYWWDYVTQVIDTWWSSTQYTVLAWVDEAKSYADALLANVNNLLTTLQSAWDDFKGRIPTLDNVIYWWSNWTGNVSALITTWWIGALTEVQGLINSAFLEREPFWSGWQDWRDKVTEFFTDPEDWLYKAADRIVERFW